jgi:hypothetical protein
MISVDKVAAFDTVAHGYTVCYGVDKTKSHIIRSLSCTSEILECLHIAIICHWRRSLGTPNAIVVAIEKLADRRSKTE